MGRIKIRRKKRKTLESRAAIPKIIELAKTFKDIDALILSCADDPAVPELKEQFDIPVIGAGSSVAIKKNGAASH